MRAAPLTQRPDFQLMKQDDVQNFYHLQVPRWLFTDSAYTGLSLEAKVVYSFLLNRFQLSRLNGWINADGEVFIIYTRKALAGEIQISYHKVIDCMKELSGLRLIWEKRCGRGDANQIYLAKVDGQACGAGSAPFVDVNDEAAGALRSEETELQDAPEMPGNIGSPGGHAASRDADLALHVSEEVQDGDFEECGDGTSKGAETARQEVWERHPSYIDSSHTDGSDTEVSPSVGGGAPPVGQDETALEMILESCHLELFEPELGKVFRRAIEQLFYSENLRVGKALLPRARVRSRLWDLDYIVLQLAESKLHQNTERVVKNSVAYTMAVIFNAITESESDTQVDHYLNAMRGDGG